MNDETFLRLSFTATIAYGLLAIAALVLAGIAFDDRGAVVAAALCAAVAYVSQSLASWASVAEEEASSDRLAAGAFAAQVVSCALWLVGLVLLCVGG